MTGWKEKMLRLLVKGRLFSRGQSQDVEKMVRSFDRIDADPALSARLDRLDEEELRSAFLELYRQEETRG